MRGLTKSFRKMNQHEIKIDHLLAPEAIDGNGVFNIIYPTLLLKFFISIVL